jgi:hypothetical protein
MKAVKALTILSILAILPNSSFADYHYASHGGSNTYPYTSWATAADSIQKAVTAASAHDTVFIATGEYNEHIEVPESTTHLGFIGMGWDSTYIWLDTIPGMQIVKISDETIIQGIKFENRGVSSCLKATWDRDMIVKSCYFMEGGRGGGIAAVDGDIFVENSIFIGHDGAVNNWADVDARVVIKNCYFNSWLSGLFLNGGWVEVRNNIGTSDLSAFFVRGGDIDTLIIANNITSNSSRAYIMALPPDSAIFQNNTSSEDGLSTTPFFPAIWLDHDADTIRMYNNTITNDNVCIYLDEEGPTNLYDFRYNNFISGIADIYDLDYPIIDTSIVYHEFPMFVGDGDFHLQAYSPLIDAGHPDILDVDGTRSDIGAYGGPGGCSYTYLDLAPLVPDSISAFVDSGAIILSWRYNLEADFNRYQIFRDTIPGFEPSIFDIIAEPDTSYYEDTDIIPGTPYYYRLTSVDNRGNISDFSEEVEVLPTSAWEIIEANLPYEPRITSAYPNPFNSNIVIVYSASNLGPQPPQVTLKVYDIQGRVVRTLVDGRMSAGAYRAVWDGTNDSGEPVASGTYIARVGQWRQTGVDFPVKITLIK